MDYKKKSLTKLSCTESYEEIDTRLASGWYVEPIGNEKKRNTKLKRFHSPLQKNIVITNK